MFSNQPSKQTEIPLQLPSPPRGIAHDEEHDDIHEPVTKCNLPTRMPQVSYMEIFFDEANQVTVLACVLVSAAISISISISTYI